uniref:Uncharacterized protein n=1 Tax=Physcomitrium patens TaxID=3218 RepID=A0A2K1IDI3_PHYPA|nr:hypothetical protein PHYPA_029484 [Physcomitrium patens]
MEYMSAAVMARATNRTLCLPPFFSRPVKHSEKSLNLHRSHVKWQSTNNVKNALENLEDKCVGLSGLFPGLRWRGAFLSIFAFLQPSPQIFEAVNILQNHAIGKGVPYLAIHRSGSGHDMAAGAEASILRGAQKLKKSAAVRPSSN